MEGAVLTCSLGSTTRKLSVPISHGSKLNGKKQANIAERMKGLNIGSFGSCKKSSPPTPCSPAVMKNWVNSKAKDNGCYDNTVQW